jgi:hypothetical protein
MKLASLYKLYGSFFQTVMRQHLNEKGKEKHYVKL